MDIEAIRDLIQSGSHIWRIERGAYQKRCPTCKAAGRESWHHLAEFHADVSQSGGLAAMCKACLRERSDEWIANNREHVAERQRANRDDDHRNTEQRYRARKIAAGWRRVNNRWVKDDD